MSKRVLITGLGPVTSVGIGREEFWNGITSGTSGISRVSSFDTSEFNRHFAGEVSSFNPRDFIPAKQLQFLEQASQLAVAAVKLALKDAKLTKTEAGQRRLALFLGTTIPEGSTIDRSSQMLLQENSDALTSKVLLSLFAPSMVRNVGHFFGFKGDNVLLPNACAAGNYTIGLGVDLIKSGQADLVICGGAEGLSRIAYQGFQRLYAMAPEVCAPFDKDRKGMILGEGAGVLIMEPEEAVLARGAKPYAEVLGYGLSCDAHHMTIPNKDGVKKAMEKALENSGIKPAQVDYISAHGTGTQANDKNESAAINEVFNNRRVPVSSIKSMLGHTMGAASALEAIACCLAARESLIPPTTNFSTFDPECDIDCVPNQARGQKVNIALNNGFAFGGNNCCVVIKGV